MITKWGNFDVTADSQPIYDDWGWAEYWSCSDWINWHKALKEKYGVEKANSLWVNAWLKGLSGAAGGYGTAPGSNWAFDSVPLDCRTLNSEFREYIKKYKPLYNVVYSGLAGTIVKPLGVVTDVVENVSSGISTTSKVIRWLIPITIIAITAFIAWKAYKKYK